MWLKIALYISNDNPKVADTFLAAVEETFEALTTLPKMGSGRTYDNPGLKDVRMLPVHGFRKHLIFYVPRPNQVEVMRVVHSARDLPTLLGGF